MTYDYDRRTAARWDNAANGESYSLRWNKTKWQLEETVDGSPIPSLRSPGEGPEMAIYEMPMLRHLLSKFDTTVSPLPTELLREAHFRADARGEDVRKALATAGIEYLKRAERELRDDHRERQADAVKHMLDQVTPKLKWKKVG
jgi:hypothetical protein